MLLRSVICAAMLVGGLTFASASSETIGYESVGYSSDGGYASNDNDLALDGTPLPEIAPDSLSDVISVEDSAHAGDGSLGERMALQHSWLNFANSLYDTGFQKFSGIGVAAGIYKSFGHGNAFEIIPGFDLDLRILWGDYSYLYGDPISVYTRLGALITMDVRTTLMFRFNWSIFYVEAGPQLGFNVIHSSFLQYEDVFGKAEDENTLILFALVPGLGVRLGDIDIGVRFVPDITDLWKEAEASMVSIQLAITYWR